MKHVIATIICISVITVYTIFSCLYIDRFSDNMLSDLLYSHNNNYSSNSIEEIKETFEDNKKALLFMVNKEHLDEIEESITRLEYAVYYDNKQDISTYENLIKNTVSEIKRSSHTLY